MRFVDTGNDPWHEVTADDALVAVPAAEANALLSPEQWRAVRESWPKELPVGLALNNDTDVESIADDLLRFALVALCFPKWVDGRAYSQARLLRARYRFAGEIRATGGVLVDMLPLLARTGFDAAVLRPDQSLATARRLLGAFPQGHYQGDVIEPRPLFARGASASATPAP
jgi:uncharacterized protein (DUF934 family)